MAQRLGGGFGAEHGNGKIDQLHDPSLGRIERYSGDDTDHGSIAGAIPNHPLKFFYFNAAL